MITLFLLTFGDLIVRACAYSIFAFFFLDIGYGLANKKNITIASLTAMSFAQRHTDEVKGRPVLIHHVKSFKPGPSTFVWIPKKPCGLSCSALGLLSSCLDNGCAFLLKTKSWELKPLVLREPPGQMLLALSPFPCALAKGFVVTEMQFFEHGVGFLAKNNKPGEPWRP